MLDARTGALLEAVNRLCGGQGYTILEEGELKAHAFPREEGDGAMLRQMLDDLRDGGYLDVRFEEAGVYCLRPLPAGRLYAERARRARREGRRRRIGLALCSALGAFLGALAGGGVWALLSLFA